MTQPDGKMNQLQPQFADTARRSDHILLRRGQLSDCPEIAELAHAAGGDVIQFTLGGLRPGLSALEVYREMVAEPNGIFSFERCVVAVVAGAVIGVANAFPARLIQHEFPMINLSERDLLLRPRFELNDWTSFLLNNICVAADHRRTGVGSALLNAVIGEARRQSHASLTLHVWADNAVAIAFYQKFGFRQRGCASIPWHVDLPHEGGSLLMKLPLRRAQGVTAFNAEAPV